MIANIIKIGNSRGLRLPKALLEQCDLNDKVQISVVKNSLVIKPLKLRSRWSEQFSKQKSSNIESVEMISNKWDDEEWQW